MEAARAQNRSSVNYVNFQIQLLKLPCRKLMFFVSRSRRMTRIQLIIILFFVGVVVDEAMVHMSTCSRSGWVFCPAEVIQYDRSNDWSSNLLLFTFLCTVLRACYELVCSSVAIFVSPISSKHRCGT